MELPAILLPHVPKPVHVIPHTFVEKVNALLAECDCEDWKKWVLERDRMIESKMTPEQHRAWLAKYYPQEFVDKVLEKVRREEDGEGPVSPVT